MESGSYIKSLGENIKTPATLYIFILGLALSDIIPTIADAFVFSKQRTLRDEYFNGTITPKQYWDKSAIVYYTYNFFYWIIIGIIIVSIKGDFQTKLKWLAGIVGAGVVFGVIYSNIKKDEKEKQLQQESLIPQK